MPELGEIMAFEETMAKFAGYSYSSSNSGGASTEPSTTSASPAPVITASTHCSDVENGTRETEKKIKVVESLGE
ncbi:hypothetical protein Hypma_002111 [Hypsizygus marmoreus]|uniref:Uncharacterized protein n=1 Tax=Hypsizygus marmoreus TaxID=39966 RepID=A0A369JZP2_HYPMA|nr:hypothetical protein Hypma_002111 [Hypsizygus marmoreus]